MKITINNVEGKTTKKGTKQNQTYTVIGESDVKKFFNAVNEKGKEVTIYNADNDWSIIGIQTTPKGRMSYTKNFTIEK